MTTPCLFCGGDASEPDHWEHCDGRQGHVEAEIILRARNSDPETSHAAMAAYDRDTLRAAAALVVTLHREHGPLADFELKGLFAESYDRPCCDHLYQQARSTARDRGLIRDSGERRVNPTTNRKQVVWEACDTVPPAIDRCASCGRLMRRHAVVVSPDGENPVL